LQSGGVIRRRARGQHRRCRLQAACVGAHFASVAACPPLHMPRPLSRQKPQSVPPEVSDPSTLACARKLRAIGDANWAAWTRDDACVAPAGHLMTYPIAGGGKGKRGHLAGAGRGGRPAELAGWMCGGSRKKVPRGAKKVLRGPKKVLGGGLKGLRGAKTSAEPPAGPLLTLPRGRLPRAPPPPPLAPCAGAVAATGDIGPQPGAEEFPDLGGRVMGNRGGTLPTILTT
jgi:hypothetical protein